MVGIMLILFCCQPKGLNLTKISSFGIVIYLSLFLNSSLLIILQFFALYYLYKNSNLSNDLIVNLITISFILNLINGIYETQNKTIYKFEFNYCEEQLDTKLC